MKAQFDGPCSLIWCREPGPHDHDRCPDCGAAGLSNWFCRTCYLAMIVTFGPKSEVVKTAGAIQARVEEIYEAVHVIETTVQD